MLRRDLLDIIFPLFCGRCGAEGSALCAICRTMVALPGIFYRAPTPALASVTSLSGYNENDALGQLITAYKYEFLTEAGEILGELIGKFFAGKNKIFARPDVIIPIPLHRRRLAERGFNQAEQLAVAVGQALFAPIKIDTLARVRATKQQAKLTRAERLINVRDAFVVKKPTQVAGRSVWLVDDVYTTGSTLEAAAIALRAAGAKYVHGFTVAHG